MAHKGGKPEEYTETTIKITLFTVGHVYRNDKEIGVTTLHGWMFSLDNSPPTFINTLQEIPPRGRKRNKATVQAPCEKKRYQVKIYPKSYHRVWIITKPI